MPKMLKSSDIHVGMRVITEQLDNITDKYIYLKDTEMVPDENGIPVYIEGTVAFIGNAEEKDRYMQEHKDEYGHQLLVANSICDGE